MSYDLKELQRLAENSLPYPGHFAGQGIVISAGGAYLASAYLCLRSLRRAGCTLPVQIWHLGQAEFPSVLAPLFTAHNAEPVDSFEIRKIHPTQKLSGWQNKPFSMLHSPFREVLSIDADNLVLRDPSALFRSPELKNFGAIFWPDFLTSTPQYWSIKPEAWKLLGLPAQRDAENESGQILVDKAACWRELQLCMHMNENSDFFYEHCSYGDKDTFTLSWAYTRKVPFRIPHRPKIAGEMIRHQVAPDGSPLFLHGRKWVLPSAKNPRCTWYDLEAECFWWLEEFEAALAKLRAPS